jgi:CRP/FNR family transcriptional regulator
MISSEKLILIRNYDLFSQLSDDEYDSLQIIHNFVEARKGEYLYFESHHLNKLFFIKKGMIKIGYINEDGEEIIKEIVHRGEIFGQYTLQPGNLHGEFAMAHKDDVSLCAFDIRDFEKLLREKPFLAIQFSKQVGQKLRLAENRLLNLLNKNVKTRLAGFFYQLALQQSDDLQTPERVVENFMTHDEIARLTGTSRQTVTTTIGLMESDGLIKVNRQQIIIPDIKKLQQQANVVD